MPVSKQEREDLNSYHEGLAGLYPQDTELKEARDAAGRLNIMLDQE